MIRMRECLFPLLSLSLSLSPVGACFSLCGPPSNEGSSSSYPEALATPPPFPLRCLAWMEPSREPVRGVKGRTERECSSRRRSPRPNPNPRSSTLFHALNLTLLPFFMFSRPASQPRSRCSKPPFSKLSTATTKSGPLGTLSKARRRSSCLFDIGIVLCAPVRFSPSPSSLGFDCFSRSMRLTSWFGGL